jgi:hypothetical protein
MIDEVQDIHRTIIDQTDILKVMLSEEEEKNPLFTFYLHQRQTVYKYNNN